jgi:hypothetical protein
MVNVRILKVILTVFVLFCDLSFMVSVILYWKPDPGSVPQHWAGTVL